MSTGGLSRVRLERMQYSNSEIQLFLALYLALGLEFQLGVDIFGTAVAPTFADHENRLHRTSLPSKTRRTLLRYMRPATMESPKPA